jgi:O-antigen ligase
MGEDGTSLSRMSLWTYGLQMLRVRPLLGIGYQNFAPYLERHARDEIDGTLLPHNIFIQASAEMGLLGLTALITLMVMTLVVNRRTRLLARPLGERGRFLRLTATGLDGALVGYIGSGFFVTVLYYPFFWINLAMTAALHVAAQDTVQRLSPALGIRSGRSP